MFINRGVHAGHTPLPKPSVEHLSTMTALRALTITDAPFSLDPSATTPPPARTPGRSQPHPLATALAALPQLTRLRFGHSARVSHLRAAGTAAPAASLFAAVAAARALVDLTVDASPSFSPADLAATASHRGLRTLRLMGSSALTQRDLVALAPLVCLSRLVLGPGFLSRGVTTVTPVFKRVLEGLLSGSGGSLEVLEVQGPLKAVLQQCLSSSLRLRRLLFGRHLGSVWTGAPPRGFLLPECADADCMVLSAVLPPGVTLIDRRADCRLRGGRRRGLGR